MRPRGTVAACALVLPLVVLALPAPAVAGPSRPVFQRTIVAAPLGSAVVRVQVPGGDFERLLRRRVLPVETRLDARRGDVRLTVDNQGPVPETATVSEGQFVVHQDAGTPQSPPRTRLELVGGGLVGCDRRWVAKAAFTRGYRTSGRKLKIRKSGGRIVTSDRHSVTAGEGTEWLVTEQCEYTRIDVVEGAVVSTPTGATGAPDLRSLLLPGDMITYACEGEPSRCAALAVTRRQGNDGRLHDIVYTVAQGAVPDDILEFCVTPPASRATCGFFRPSGTLPNGAKTWGTYCTMHKGPGTYQFRWILPVGRRFSPLLPLEILHPEPTHPQDAEAAAGCGPPPEQQQPPPEQQP